MQDNPYQAPVAAVADPANLRISANGEFSAQPRSHSAGAGVTWLSQAWEQFKTSPGVWIAITLVLLAGSILTQMLPLIGAFIPGLIYPTLSAGIMIGCDAISRGEKLRFNHLFSGFGDRLLPLIIFTVIYFLAYNAVSAAVFISLLGTENYLGILGGAPESIDMGELWMAILINMLVSIPIFAGYWLAIPLITLNQMEPVEAIKLSLKGCLINLLPLIVLALLTMLMFIVSLIPLGLGVLISLPVMLAAMYTSYRAIFYR